MVYDIRDFRRIFKKPSYTCQHKKTNKKKSISNPYLSSLIIIIMIMYLEAADFLVGIFHQR